jgi:hypothetical protein
MKELKVHQKLEILDKAILLETNNQENIGNRKKYQEYYKEMVTLVTEKNQFKSTIKFNLENLDKKALKELQLQLEILGKTIELEKDNSKDCPLWKEFLEETLPDQESIDLLQEWFGYCLENDSTPCFHRALVIFGKGLGKTTAISILEEMLGRDRCSHSEISDLSDPFHCTSLQSCLLNISKKFEAKSFKDECFKSLVALEPVTAYLGDMKNLERVDFIPKTKLCFEVENIGGVYSALPSGLKKRMILIQFQNTDLECNFDLKGLLLTEISAIRGWAREGLKRLVSRGRFKPCASTKRV